MPKTTRRALLQARGVHWNGIWMTFLLYLLARFILGLRGPVTLQWLGGGNYSNYGDRCFAGAGPKLWSSLPADLQ